MSTYRVMLIGCGHMGKAHVSKIYCLDNVELTAVCDLDIEKAKMFQKMYAAKHITSNYREMLDKVDIVIIATYPSTHLQILKDCIDAKVHVLCEKPITCTLEEGKKFIDLARSAPVKVLTGYILRHHETYNKLAEMIKSGAIGFPIIMRMSQNHHTMDWQKYLKLIEESSPIIDCGVHYYDVMRWVTGAEIESVNGIGICTEADVPEGKYNYGLTTVKLTDGSIGYYEAGWTNTMTADNTKEFVGPKGRIRLVYSKDRFMHKEEGDLLEYYRYPEKIYTAINIKTEYRPTDKQFEYLVKMIEENVPAKPSYDDVWASFKAALDADACIRAAGIGRENS